MTQDPARPSLDLTDLPVEGKPAPLPLAQQKAVAVGYERGVDDAPRVLASGRGAVAEQILAVAFERGIKVREDAELVDILSLVEVDSPIPLEAFTAVAEILARVYQANAALKHSSHGGAHG